MASELSILLARQATLANKILLLTEAIKRCDTFAALCCCYNKSRIQQKLEDAWEELCLIEEWIQACLKPRIA